MPYLNHQGLNAESTKPMRVSSSQLGVDRYIEPFRRPEYTGENRCMPCTVLNLVIAGIVSLAIGWLHLVAGVGVAIASLSLIYLRGYLVPGTPTLTRRYLPTWLLSWFHGDSHHHDSIDGESFLLRTGIIRDDPDVDDLILDPTFETAWMARVDSFDSLEAAEAILGRMIGSADIELDFNGQGGPIAAYAEGQWVAEWESRTAFLADIAGSVEIENRFAGWRGLPITQRSQVLGLLRFFLDQCPSCSGDIVFSGDVVRSCCQSIDVLAATCRDCNDRIFEAPYDVELLNVMT